jgi:hypothetical protein
MNIEENEVIQKLKGINPRYVFVYEDSTIAKNDLFVAVVK